ncbi:hypothetical protein ADUPG1_009889, partial [Aduncisulcus paluster]
MVKFQIFKLISGFDLFEEIKILKLVKSKDRAHKAIVEGLREPLRGLEWLGFLGVLGEDSGHWPNEIKFITDQFLSHKSLEKSLKPTRNLIADNPLAACEGGVWDFKFEKAEAEQDITIDLERLFPEIDFFRQGYVQSDLLKILRAWALDHKAQGYRQGMHEIAAVFYLILDIMRLGAEKWITSASSDLKSQISEYIPIFTSDCVCALTHAALTCILNVTGVWFGLKNPTPGSSQRSTPSMTPSHTPGTHTPLSGGFDVSSTLLASSSAVDSSSSRLPPATRYIPIFTSDCVCALTHAALTCILNVTGVWFGLKNPTPGSSQRSTPSMTPSHTPGTHTPLSGGFDVSSTLLASSSAVDSSSSRLPPATRVPTLSAAQMAEAMLSSLLSIHDPALNRIITKISGPVIVVLRWVRLLWGREWAIDSVFRLWDVLFGHSYMSEIAQGSKTGGIGNSSKPRPPPALSHVCPPLSLIPSIVLASFRLMRTDILPPHQEGEAIQRIMGPIGKPSELYGSQQGGGYYVVPVEKVIQDALIHIRYGVAERRKKEEEERKKRAMLEAERRKEEERRIRDMQSAEQDDLNALASAPVFFDPLSSSTSHPSVPQQSTSTRSETPLSSATSPLSFSSGASSTSSGGAVRGSGSASGYPGPVTSSYGNAQGGQDAYHGSYPAMTTATSSAPVFHDALSGSVSPDYLHSLTQKPHNSYTLPPQPKKKKESGWKTFINSFKSKPKQAQPTVQSYDVPSQQGYKIRQLQTNTITSSQSISGTSVSSTAYNDPLSSSIVTTTPPLSPSP